MTDNSLMKRAFVVVLGFLGLSCPVKAQHMTPSLDGRYTFALYRPEVFRTIDSSTLIERLPVRSFLDGTRFPVSSEMGRMGMTSFDLPSMASEGSAEVQEIGVRREFRTEGKD